MKNERKYATSEEMEEAEKLFETIEEWLGFFRAAAKLCRTSLAEVRRTKEMLSRHKLGQLVPGDFIAELAREGDHLYEELSKANIFNFELGRLSLEARDGENYCSLMFNLERLKERLKEKYGADFDVRVRHKKSA